MSLMKKLNKFIFHKYREIILNNLLSDENFDNLATWEEGIIEKAGIIALNQNEESSSKEIGFY